MDTKTGLDVLECEIRQLEATVYTLKRCLRLYTSDKTLRIRGGRRNKMNTADKIRLNQRWIRETEEKIADAELNKEDSFVLTKVGNEDDYLEYKQLCGRLEAFKEVLNEIEEYYM